MSLSIRDMRSRAHQFVSTYADTQKENAESQSFLNDLFNIFGIPRRRVASFERPVKVDDKGTKRIDLFWPGQLLVEMKSEGECLDKASEQAINYLRGIKDKELPRYVLVCDFKTFRLRDFEANDQAVYEFDLVDLVDNLDLFSFMLGKEMQDITEYELNERAALLLGELHDSLEKTGFAGHPLQVFMIRVLFCMFAEDTGIFNPRQFIRYLLRFTHESGHDTELHLYKIFQVLDTPFDKRSTNLPDEQAEFPYANGHLFKERIDMPSFDADMRQKLIECCYFNWKDVSPAVFGSLFQSIMDKEQRRNMGAHYTSEANIHKVIDPLFLDQLKSELDKITELKRVKERNERLMAFITKLRKLTFLDPACGCGNFLIVAYRELRKLELKALYSQHGGSIALSLEIQPAIPLNNFYGIEIDEWPARIAEVAMVLTQHQMNVEFAKAFGEEPDLLPLREHVNLHHTNALELDWSKVIKPDELSYIIGNPPFIGSKMQTKEQKQLQLNIWGATKNARQLDFVANWFYKSAQYAFNTDVEVGLVATNSISMGEQVATLWAALLDMGIKINFAHRTFEWDSEGKGKAAVHCIIVGFSHVEKEAKWLFDYPDIKGEPIQKRAENINPYLTDAPNIFIETRNNALNASNPLWFGNMPMDGGFLLLAPDEKKDLLHKQPTLEKWIKPLLGAREFINNQRRYCLWLADASIKELRDLMQIPEIQERVNGVKAMRLSSSDAGTRKQAETPWKFRDTRNPKTFLLVPRVSSERRSYVPIGFFDDSVVSSDANLMVPNGTLYEFAILTSEIHMDWMRTVAGRLKNDYRYSARLVYNNFPWPTITDKQKERIEKLAQTILDVRQEEFDKDATTSLADLYDPDLMPIKLRRAHQALDKAVDRLYESKGFKTSLDRVKHLFELYENLVSAA